MTPVTFGDARMPDRFWSKLSVDSNECWNYLGSKSKGYGRFWSNGRAVQAHRIAYDLLAESISDALVLDHLCRNRACCNPSHLEAVSNSENLLRGDGPPARNARKTHCIRGHELTADNLIACRLPKRECRECGAASDARYELRKQQLALAS